MGNIKKQSVGSVFASRIGNKCSEYEYIVQRWIKINSDADQKNI